MAKVSAEVANLLTNVAGILDVIKGEWSAGNAWSEWDQQQRDAISRHLVEYHDGPGEEDGPWAEGWVERSRVCPACAHPDGHHFDDGFGNIVCRHTTECPCAYRVESSTNSGGSEHG